MTSDTTPQNYIDEVLNALRAAGRAPRARDVEVEDDEEAESVVYRLWWLADLPLWEDGLLVRWTVGTREPGWAAFHPGDDETESFDTELEWGFADTIPDPAAVASAIVHLLDNGTTTATIDAPRWTRADDLVLVPA